MLTAACVAHINPVFTGVVHPHEYIRFCRALCARKMCVFLKHVNVFLNHVTIFAYFWMRAINFFTVERETHTHFSELKTHLKSTTEILGFPMDILIFILVISPIFLYFSKLIMQTSQEPISTPRLDRKPVPSKLSAKTNNKQSGKVNSATLSKFVKIDYPATELLSAVDVSRACMKYKAFRFGIDNLSESLQIVEIKRFAIFYNDLPLSITELFDVQAAKLKYDAAGLSTFTALQQQFIIAGDNADIQMELVSRAYKKPGSPTRERIVRTIQREKVAKDAKEYRPVIEWTVLEPPFLKFSELLCCFLGLYNSKKLETPDFLKNPKFSEFFGIFFTFFSNFFNFFEIFFSNFSDFFRCFSMILRIFSTFFPNLSNFSIFFEKKFLVVFGSQAYKTWLGTFFSTFFQIFGFSIFLSFSITVLYARKAAENKAIEDAELDCPMNGTVLQQQQEHQEKVALENIQKKQLEAEKNRKTAAASAAANSESLNLRINGQPNFGEQATPEALSENEVIGSDFEKSSDSEDSDSLENAPWMVAGKFKQKYLPKQTAVTASEVSKIFEISLLHNTSEIKWAVLMNLVKSVFKKIEVNCAIVGTKDHFLTNTKSRSVVKVISLRLDVDQDTSRLIQTIQEAAPTLNIDTPAAVLKAANAAEYSWRGLSAILGDNYGAKEIQLLLESAAPTRFRITDFSVEATTDELTHLNIQRDTCKTKILDNEGDLEDVDEFIFVKAVTLHGVETTASAKALNLYEKFENLKLLIFLLVIFCFLNGFFRLSRSAATIRGTFSSTHWERSGSAVKNAEAAIISPRTVKFLTPKYGQHLKSNAQRKLGGRCQPFLNDYFVCNTKNDNFLSVLSSVLDLTNKFDNYLNYFLLFHFEGNSYHKHSLLQVVNTSLQHVLINTTINLSVAHSHYYD